MTFEQQNTSRNNTAPQQNSSIFDVNPDHTRTASTFRGTDDIQLILVRDLHCLEEVQMCIAHSIEDIYKQTGISMVLLEGADGPVRTLLFRSFPDEEVHVNVSREFLKNGYLTGAEFAAISMGILKNRWKTAKR